MFDHSIPPFPSLSIFSLHICRLVWPSIAQWKVSSVSTKGPFIAYTQIRFVTKYREPGAVIMYFVIPILYTVFSLYLTRYVIKGEVFSKNSSNHIFAFLANFFECWRLLISWVNQLKVSKIKKNSPKSQNLWFDEFFENTSHLVYLFEFGTRALQKDLVI